MAFGDYEPEDAWHPDDDVADQIRNLVDRVRLVDGDPGPVPTFPLEAIDAIRARAVAAYARPLDGRALVRLSQILDDVGTVRARLS